MVMVSKTELVHYEVAGSLWAGFISNAWMQNIVAAYFAHKVDRKFRRWMKARAWRAANTRDVQA